MKTKLFLTIITLISFSQSCDNHKRGADQIKNSTGWCLWYVDSKDDKYCAYSRVLPPAGELNYTKCNDEENLKKVCSKSILEK